MTGVQTCALPISDTAALRARLHGLNPLAPLLDRDAPAEALIPDAAGPEGRFDDWLGALPPQHWHPHGHDPNRHDARIRALCLRFEAPLRWENLATWLEMMAVTQGERLLRLKAVLNLVGEAGPVALHGVRHSFDPPRRLARWPDGDDRSSRIVLILRDLDPAVVEQGLRAFLESA